MAVWRDGINCETHDTAVDMPLRLDKAYALPTSPQPQHQASRKPGPQRFVPDLEIPAAVEALRQYWMPIRYASGR